MRDADLVASERIGAEQRYRLTPRPLKHLLDWSDRYRTLIDPQGHAWTFVPNPGKQPSSAPETPAHPKSRTPGRVNNGR